MSDPQEPGHPTRPRQRRPPARRGRRPCLSAGNGGPTTPAGPACRGSGSSCWSSAALLLHPAGLPAVPGARLGLRPGDRPRVHHQVGDRSRHRLALRRGDHHRARRAGPAQRGRRSRPTASSTFSFGIAFLFIAAVRAFSGGGIGWQLWFGGFLTLLGGVNIAGASFGGYLVPIVLVALGLLLILRGAPSRVR